MRQFLRNAFGFLAPVFLLLLTACASMELQPSLIWKDPSYQTVPKKIMVIGVARQAVNRRVFEDEFVQQLRDHGADAIASYTVLPDELQNDRKAIADKVAELGADAVLITRRVSQKTVQTYIPGTVYYPPPHYGSWQDYYGYGYDAMYTPGYVAEQELAVVESNLYDAASDKLVWASTTEIGKLGSDRDIIKRYIGVVMKAMLAQGLI